MKRTTTRRATTPGGQFAGTPGMSAGRDAAHSGHSALLELALHGLHSAVLAMDADGRVYADIEGYRTIAMDRPIPVWAAPRPSAPELSPPI